MRGDSFLQGKFLESPRPRARLGWLLGGSFLTGLLLTLLSQLMAGQSPGRMFTWVIEHPLALLASALLLALWTLTLAGLTRNLWLGALLVSFLCLIPSLITYYKEMITGEPLTLADFALAGRLGQIAGLNSSSLTVSLVTVLTALLTLGWVAVLVVFRRQTRLGWRGSLIAAFASGLAFMLLFCLTSVVNFWVYEPLDSSVDQGYSQTYVNRRCGVVLGLWRGVVYQDVLVSEYSQRAMAATLSRLEEAADDLEPVEQKEEPNIILILSESFFDVTTLEGVTYKEDPLAGFHALEKEGVSGTFYTRTLGYGTCNIEMEILTGINDKLLSYGENLTQWPSSRFTKLPSIPALLGDAGYYTAAVHTFNDEIYRRKNRFLSLGFDQVFFSEDFDQIDPAAAKAADYWAYLRGKIAGEFFGDDYMTDLLINLYEAKKKAGPVFLYGITMENHAPFTQDKYSGYDFSWTTSKTLTREAQGALNAVTQGTADASEALVKLTDYFRDQEEPTVILFYGDHRPGLGLDDGSSLYSQLGICGEDSSRWEEEDWMELYATSYLIWSNDPDYLPQRAGSQTPQSSNYFGLEILKAAGQPLPLYWTAIEALSRENLIYTGAYYLDREENFSYILPEDASFDLRRKFADLAAIYHDAFRQQYITAQLRR